MIKPNDFRLGNFIIDEDGDILPIVGIYKDEIKLPGDYSHDIDHVSPIKLTEQWMKRCEMVKTSEGLWTHKRFYGFQIYWNERMNFYHGSQIAGIGIDCLHNLQNLFYELSGEELKVDIK